MQRERALRSQKRATTIMQVLVAVGEGFVFLFTLAVVLFAIIIIFPPIN